MVVSLKERVKNAISGSWLYRPARNVFQIVFNRDARRYRLSMRKFYGQFFRRGDLVFDVGANIGEYSGVFSDLGATVVAVEPNPACCKSLFHLAHLKNIRVEGCAVGNVVGSAHLRLCDSSQFSTLSDEWFESSLKSTTYQNVRWLEQIEVPVVTLDLLAHRHGIPSFVKIDVEGYEANVINGMNFKPKFLSFEFSNVRREGAFQCLLRLGKMGYEFNAMLSRDFSFQFSHWKTSPEAVQWLTEYDGKEEFGDIFARQSRSQTQESDSTPSPASLLAAI